MSSEKPWCMVIVADRVGIRKVPLVACRMLLLGVDLGAVVGVVGASRRGCIRILLVGSRRMASSGKDACILRIAVDIHHRTDFACFECLPCHACSGTAWSPWLQWVLQILVG